MKAKAKTCEMKQSSSEKEAYSYTYPHLKSQSFQIKNLITELKFIEK